MIATLVVAAVLILAINLVNMIQTNRNLDAVLMEMSGTAGVSRDDWEIDGMGSSFNAKESDHPEPGGTEQDASDGENWPEENEEFPNGKKSGKKDQRTSAANQYLGRYFSIMIPSDEDWIVGEHIQELPEDEELKSLVETIRSSASTSGYLDDYRYLYREDNNVILISFLDCTTELRAQRRLLWISIAVGGIGILLTFLFIFYVSGKIVFPLKESMEKQKRFITDAGHELKTPLSVISTNMDILSLDLGKNEWVDGTKQQVRKLRDLVNHLISLSKLDEGTAAAQHLKFDLTAAVAESADPFQIMAESHGKDLQQDIEKGLQYTGDEPQIRQLVTILCDNAVKYALDTEPIIVKLYRDGKHPVLETVNAWNRESAPEDLSRFFDRFYRADSSRDRSSGQNSYGLGLPIALGLAQQNRIQLTVREDRNGRLVFRAVFDG